MLSVAAIVHLGGCSALVGSKEPSTEELAAADKRGDLPYLDQACADAPSKPAEPCILANIIRAEKSTDCAFVMKVYKETPRRHPNYQNNRDVWGEEWGPRLGKKLAGCGEYNVIFEQMSVHQTDHPDSEAGVDLLARIEKSGAPLDAEWLKYLASHPGPKLLPIEYDGLAMKHIGIWLTNAGHTGHCAEFGAALTGAKLGPTGNGLKYYLWPNKCAKEAVPVAVELLTSDNELARQTSCEALGDLGDGSVLPKLKILASSDSYNEVVEKTSDSGAVYGVKVFPVRDACKAAAGKIELREAK